jgi:hypothetical protein
VGELQQLQFACDLSNPLRFRAFRIHFAPSPNSFDQLRLSLSSSAGRLGEKLIILRFAGRFFDERPYLKYDVDDFANGL